MMKKLFHFNFSIFRSGGALRHSPLCSLIIALVFVLYSSAFPSYASAQMVPQFNPIMDTEIVSFQSAYNSLDPAAQAAANILFGAYVTEYAGLADYGTVFDEVPSDGTVWDRLEFTGQQLVDTFFLPYNMANQLVITPLINLGQGIVNYVKSVDDVAIFKENILDSSSYGLSYSSDIGFALNQVFAREGGLYSWQFDTESFDFPFTWSQYSNTIPDVAAASYNQYLSEFSGLRIFSNATGGRTYNLLLNLPSDFHFNLLIGSSFVHAYDDSGNKLNYLDYSFDFLCYYYVNSLSVSSGSLTGITFNDFSFSDLSGVQSIINSYCNSNPVSFNNEFFFSLSSLVEHVYVGNSWSSKQEVFNDTDLGFVDTDSLELLNPIDESIFDLKALVEQIVAAQPDPDYELPLQPIIYNITEVNGSSLTADDLQSLSFNVSLPDSGVTVPDGVWDGLATDDHDGFIDYLWYMTKPLIQFTSGFIESVTFGPEGGFDETGPGIIVFGVISLGLAGGLVSKFLL